MPDYSVPVNIPPIRASLEVPRSKNECGFAGKLTIIVQNRTSLILFITRGFLFYFYLFIYLFIYLLFFTFFIKS